MKRCIDIYSGWIVAIVDGQWRHVHISTGFVTVADFWEPNQHVGVLRAEDLAKAEQGEWVRRWDVATCPFALVAGPVLEEDILERIAFVRFGRVGGEEHARRLEISYLIDAPLESNRLYVACNYDDQDGLPEEWPRLPPPATPGRWVRTSRSLVVS